MGALADRLQRVLGGADEAHDLRVLELAVIAQQPQDGVRPVLPARQWGVAGAARLLGLRRADLRDGEMQAEFRIALRLGDLLAGELAGRDRVVALDAGRHLAVGDAFDLERMQFAEFRDLVEGQGGVFDQPDGGRLRHQRRVAHCRLAPSRSIGRAGSVSGPKEAQPQKTKLRGMPSYRRRKAELQSPARIRLRRRRQSPLQVHQGGGGAKDLRNLALSRRLPN